jgi:uncharacterized Ntn-hydrolase superfamily protein
VTFALVGRCAETGMLGVAVSSSSPAVAARCAHVRARVGAASTQNVTDPRLGPAMLDALERRVGDPVRAVLDRYAAHRQLLCVDASGRTWAHSGEGTLGRHAERCDRDVAAAGNLLASDGVPGAMADAFAEASGHLGMRLLAGLRAGLDAGGEEGPVRSAGMLVADDVAWPTTDLRVDWDDDPIAALERLWAVWESQIADYRTRALDPTAAPSFGVPGDRG